MPGVEIPPYQLQSLISVVGENFALAEPEVAVLCAQAVGPDIYVGCSNGELLRFTLQSADSYTLYSRQSVPNDKPVEDIVVLPTISRALVLSDRQVFLYTVPALDLIPTNIYRPIRIAVGVAVDEQQLRNPSRAPYDNQQPPGIDFCVIKRQAVQLYHLRDKPVFLKEIPLPSRVSLAKRSSHYLCIADQDNYNVINLESASLVPLLPISQAPDQPADLTIKPFILVISEIEFLILSFTGASTLGLFITGNGDPVRGTLQWDSHPVSVSFNHPHVTTLMADGSVEIHSIDSQSLVQVVPPPSSTPTPAIPIPTDRRALLAAPAGFLAPSYQRAAKLKPTTISLARKKPTGVGDAVSEKPEANADVEEVTDINTRINTL